MSSDNRNSKHGNRYTDEELVDDLQTLADELGRTPTARQIHSADGCASISPYVERFGSVREAQEAAGLEPNDPYYDVGSQYNRDELLAWIQAWVKCFDFVPSARDFASGGPFPSARTYKLRFGSFTEAVREAGYTPRGDRR